MIKDQYIRMELKLEHMGKKILIVCVVKIIDNLIEKVNSINNIWADEKLLLIMNY